jgi:hypothetical protein
MTSEETIIEKNSKNDAELFIVVSLETFSIPLGGKSFYDY